MSGAYHRTGAIPTGWALPPEHWHSNAEQRSSAERCRCGRKSKVWRAAVHAPLGEPCRVQYACSIECIQRRVWLEVQT